MTGRHGTRPELEIRPNLERFHVQRRSVGAPSPGLVFREATTGKRRPAQPVVSVQRGPLAVPRVQVVRFLAVAVLLAVLAGQWFALLPLVVLLVVVLRAR